MKIINRYRCPGCGGPTSDQSEFDICLKCGDEWVREPASLADGVLTVGAGDMIEVRLSDDHFDVLTFTVDRVNRKTVTASRPGGGRRVRPEQVATITGGDE